MIVDGLLLLLQGVLNIILLPLSALNIGIDFLASIPIVENFMQVITYVLPWDNILPLIILVFAIFTFRIIVALIGIAKQLIPFL
ncbi:MAG: hypothetical protein ILA02_03680 [Clostridia bacterium]|nr:hypothetical protein [Clostridia bacterium]